MPSITFNVKRSGGRKFHKASLVARKKMADVLRDDIEPELIDAFEEIVADWENEPSFDSRLTIRSDVVSLFIFPSGNKEVYEYVTLGTRPHKITAKYAWNLAFLWGGPSSYLPKTEPGGIYGGPGRVVGGVMHFPQAVQHPGFVGRDFEGFVANDKEDFVNDTLADGWSRIIRGL